jgi:hypothetical protein
MKLLLIFSIVAIAMVAVFALYFSFVPQLFPFTKTLGEFSAMFQPLEAFFTALAFVALVITSSRQSKELQDTKKQTTEVLGLAFRLQASGMRLISMAVQWDPQTADARRELENQVEEFERMLQR